MYLANKQYMFMEIILYGKLKITSTCIAIEIAIYFIETTPLNLLYILTVNAKKIAMFFLKRILVNHKTRSFNDVLMLHLISHFLKAQIFLKVSFTE